jgi:4-hydroxybenzoate polyprenyltransferase
MALLRLVRWTNLLIVFMTQLAVWGCIIRPVSSYDDGHFLLSPGNFLWLSLSTVLIAGAGYIINDYFDIRIDNINRPEKMVLERIIPRRMAIILHTALNVLAIILALIVIRRGGHYSWLLLQLTCTLLLWFYSTKFKRQFAIGNVVVAVLTALTVLVLLVYEPGLHRFIKQRPFLHPSPGEVLVNPVWMLCVYAYFAFILTWMREIVKDMEDFKGDEAEGCVTMPIKWGLRKAERFTILLGATAVIPLAIVAVLLLKEKDVAMGAYTILALILPLSAWIFFLPRAATTEHYGKASRYLKLIMVAGIGSLIIYYFEANA